MLPEKRGKQQSVFVIIIYGLPGAGKSYCAKKLSEILNDSPLVDSDAFLTCAEIQAIKESRFTPEKRRHKVRRLLDYVKDLLAEGHRCVVAEDALPDNHSRKLVLDYFGEERVLLVRIMVDHKTHLKRLSKREEHFFTADLLPGWIQQHWEEPTLPYIIFNNSDHVQIEKELRKIMNLLYIQGIYSIVNN